MLSEKVSVDGITVRENGVIEVRTATIVFRDDLEIARSYHRHTLSPGDDIANEEERVAAIAATVWTEEVITAYKAQLASSEIV